MRDEQRIYKLLKENGHSAMKAAEILLDVKRGDKFATEWVKTLIKKRKGGAPW